ncbi:MAG: Gfo/Idh/MocA family protein [Bacteroidales bacterium]
MNPDRRQVLKSLGAACLAPALFDRPRVEAAVPEILPEPALGPRFRALDRPLDAIIVGGGNRGWLYAQYARTNPTSMRVVGLAEPVPIRREKFKTALALDDAAVFSTWEHVFDRPRFADFVIVTTMDGLHYAPAMRAMALGYHVLLEKAIAQSWQQCQEIREQARKHDRIVGICHVLRYAPYFLKMRDVIRSGEIGDVLSVQHLEPIGNIHMSHSFVRGNWRNEKESTPILLSKSCHDLDLFHWMLAKPCRKVSSFGRLSAFTSDCAPAGSTARCTDGCAVERTCPYSAPRIYVRDRSWDVGHVIDLQPWEAGKVMAALKQGPYGRCAFRCDNDVPDHQVVNLEFEGGTTVAFSMIGHTTDMGRRTRVMGTLGDLVGDEQVLTVNNFSARRAVAYTAAELAAGYAGGGHGGGDMRLVRAFLQAVSQGDRSLLSSTIEDSMESHRIGFHAEESRRKGGAVITLGDPS